MLAIAGFHAAYTGVPAAAMLFVLGLLGFARALPARAAFYGTLMIGLACYAPHLVFFVTLFKALALVLWLILALPLALVALTASTARRLLPAQWPIALLPVVWTGLEYARCELYALRFAWLTPGIAMGNGLLVRAAGAYGAGFVLAAIAAGILLLPGRWRILGTITGLGLAALLSIAPAHEPTPGPKSLFLTGIQLEMASEREILAALDAALSAHPETNLFILPEYALASPPTESLKHWCILHSRHLLVGGTMPTADRSNFYNTAFVIAPTGEVVFSQAKSVPIQFFRDGLSAPSQRVWESPWGKIGICICYDLSYTRVTDRLVRQGAELLIVPTMDARSWGAQEHTLHARIAPARAAEYAIPIVRVATSGISQLVTAKGHVTASASFPGEGELVAGRIVLGDPGRLPPDRWLAPVSVAATLAAWTTLLIRKIRQNSSILTPETAQELASA